VPQFCGLKKHMASLMTIESVSFAAFLGIICTAALIFRALY